MTPSWIQIAIVVALLVLLFGRGRISALMGDVAKGIKSFRAGLADDAKPERVTKATASRTTASTGANKAGARKTKSARKAR